MDNWDLNEAQLTVARAMSSFDPEIPRMYLWSGSVRAGKTWGMALAACLAALRRGDGGQWIVAGRSVGALERNILPSLLEHAQNLGLQGRYVRSRRTWEMAGNEFRFFGGVDARSQDLVQGMTAAGAFIDEAALLPRDFIMQCLARCSEPLSRIVMTCNPAGPGHWLKREFFDRAEELGAVTLHSGLLDNPSLSEDALRFYRTAFTGHYKRRMVDGEWVGATGLVFPRFNVYHGVDIDSVLFDIGIDWGASAPTAAVCLVRRGQIWLANSEYYWRGGLTGERTVAEHASAIEGMMAVHGRAERILIDPSAASLRTELSRRGHYARRANNDREAGIQALSTALALGDVLVGDRCEELIRELETLEWDEANSLRGEDVVDVLGDDHAVDALRYWCMDRLPPRIESESRNLPVGF